MNKFAIVFAASAALFSSASFAQGYVGGSLGFSEVDVDCAGTTLCDTSDVGGKLFGGYTVADGFSVEAVYFNFGKQKFSDGIDSGSTKTSSFGLGGAYRLPFNAAWLGTARLGLSRNKVKGEGGSETSTQPYLGLGVGYKVMQNLTIDAGIDFTRFKAGGEKANSALFGVGATFSF